MTVKMRADQVREGERIGGATVMRVRQTFDPGLVRITVESESRTSHIADGTFCFLAGDILEVDRPGHPEPH